MRFSCFFLWAHFERLRDNLLHLLLYHRYAIHFFIASRRIVHKKMTCLRSNASYFKSIHDAGCGILFIFLYNVAFFWLARFKVNKRECSRVRKANLHLLDFIVRRQVGRRVGDPKTIVSYIGGTFEWLELQVCVAR
jgi:hypothetical protein